MPEADHVAEWCRSSKRHVITGGSTQLVQRVAWLVCRAGGLRTGGRLRGRHYEHPQGQCSSSHPVAADL